MPGVNIQFEYAGPEPTTGGVAEKRDDCCPCDRHRRAFVFSRPADCAAPSALTSSGGCGMRDSVVQHADSFHFDFDGVSRRHGLGLSGSSGEDDVARKQSDELSDIAD